MMCKNIYEMIDFQWAQKETEKMVLKNTNRLAYKSNGDKLHKLYIKVCKNDGKLIFFFLKFPIHLSQKCRSFSLSI